MTSLGVRLDQEARRSISSATLTGSYQVVGSTFANPIILLKIVNNSDQDIDVSYNGTTDHDIVPANGFTLYDFNANRYRTGGCQLKVGSGVYVKGSAGTGTIYVVSFYMGVSP